MRRNRIAAARPRSSARTSSSGPVINPTPSNQKAGAESMWSTSQPKFIPKNPVRKVSGKKTVAITVSLKVVSLS